MAEETNPYTVPAGAELDRLIHCWVMKEGEADPPPYSTDEKAARRVLARLKAGSGRAVIVGQTALRKKPWFARYETDPSDGTEVLAETLPLAICRLAMLQAAKDRNLDVAGS